MHVYSLKPLDHNYTGWSYSTYKGDVVVRAATEADARALANHHFTIFASVDHSHDGAASPWTQSSIVSCDLVEESLLQSDVTSEIISPKQ